MTVTRTISGNTTMYIKPPLPSEPHNVMHVPVIGRPTAKQHSPSMVHGSARMDISLQLGVTGRQRHSDWLAQIAVSGVTY
jgi:hypothetical protein